MPSVHILMSGGGGLAGAVVKWFTWSRYSHVDLVDPRHGIPRFVVGAVPFQGVTRRSYARVASQPGTARYELSNPRLNIAAMLAFIDMQLGKPYDWRGVLGFLPRSLDWQDPDRWFCSELVFAAAAVGGVELLHDVPARITPRDLVRSPYMHEVPL